MVSLDNCGGGWCEVEFEGSVAYVSADYVSGPQVCGHPSKHASSVRVKYQVTLETDTQLFVRDNLSDDACRFKARVTASERTVAARALSEELATPMAVVIMVLPGKTSSTAARAAISLV